MGLWKFLLPFVVFFLFIWLYSNDTEKGKKTEIASQKKPSLQADESTSKNTACVPCTCRLINLASTKQPNQTKLLSYNADQQQFIQCSMLYLTATDSLFPAAAWIFLHLLSQSHDVLLAKRVLRLRHVELSRRCCHSNKLTKASHFFSRQLDLFWKKNKDAFRDISLHIPL